MGRAEQDGESREQGWGEQSRDDGESREQGWGEQRAGMGRA